MTTPPPPTPPPEGRHATALFVTGARRNTPPQSRSKTEQSTSCRSLFSRARQGLPQPPPCLPRREQQRLPQQARLLQEHLPLERLRQPRLPRLALLPPSAAGPK